MARAFLRSIRAKKRKAIIANLSKIARQEIDKALDEVALALKKSHEIIVRDWKSDVSFKVRRIVTPKRITVVIFPTGEDAEVWVYVNEGTKPHVITPKQPGGKLAFQWGGPGSYQPKTLPNPARVVAGGGRVVGGKPTFATRVQHPGSEGRGFTKRIAKEIEPDFRRVMENAFRRAARRTYE